MHRQVVANGKPGSLMKTYEVYELGLVTFACFACNEFIVVLLIM